MAISADGNTAAVGGLGDDPANDGTTAGAVWVWVRNEGVWTQQGPKLVGLGAVLPAGQGAAVALSADGNTLIVGGALDDYSAPGLTSGPAWIWVRNGAVWTQQGNKPLGGGVVRIGGVVSPGKSVSLSADGNTAIVGASGGGASVWIRSGTAWSQQGPILGCCGTAVALSADGNTALVGGAGAAVWTRSGGVWNQQGPTLAGSGPGGQTSQIASVALSADGNTAITGTWFGGVWIWTRGKESWNQQGGRLNDPSTVALGSSVSLSADGNTALIGGRYDGYVSSTEGATGAAWIFTRNGGAWHQQSNKVIGSGAVGHAFQGTSVALSGDGHTAIVGGPSDNQGSGAAWVFTESPVLLRRRSSRP